MAENPNCGRGNQQAFCRRAASFIAMNQAMKMQPKPNLLFIFCDQMSSWAMSAYARENSTGNPENSPEIDTPHLDRLAAEGAKFNQFFTNVALCTPSRACFMTGCYPQQTGILEGTRAMADDQITFAHQLLGAGYRTGYSGKWHLAGQREEHSNWAPTPNFGWQDNRYMWNRGHFKHIEPVGSGDAPVHGERRIVGDENSYASDWLTARAKEFIDEHADHPFAYTISFPDPHQPYRAREPYVSMFPEDQIRIPSTFWQEDVPAWIEEGREKKDFPMKAENRKDWNRDREATLRNVKANYCAMVKHIDDCVGQLYAKLEEHGILDQTLIVFSTDHGDLMGEHGMTGKNYLYEPAYRIPMVMRLPSSIPAGSDVDQLISTVDFMPTILDLMNVPKSDREEGRSAAGFVSNDFDPPQDWDEIVFTHPYSMERVACFTPEYELGFDEGGDAILFDRIKDPEQVNNLFYDEAYKDIITALAQRMRAHYQVHCTSVLEQWLDPRLTSVGA